MFVGPEEIVGAAWQLERVRRMETEAGAGKSTYTEMLDDELLQKKLMQAQRQKEGTITSDDLPRIHARLQRTHAAAASAISERSQSAPAVAGSEKHSAPQPDPTWDML